MRDSAGLDPMQSELNTLFIVNSLFLLKLLIRPDETCLITDLQLNLMSLT